MPENKQIKRQPCEIFTRVVGYMRPVKQFNDAKRAEYFDRKNFKV